MRDTGIRIRPYDLCTVTDYSGIQQCNEHAQSQFIGVLTSNLNDDEIEKMLLQDFAEVVIIREDGKEEVVFAGVVTDATVKNESGIRKLYATIKSITILLDNKSHIRTFQNTSTTYYEITNQITAKYHSPIFLFPHDAQKAINTIVVQYEETDWQFLKRLASHFNTVIIPNNIRKDLSFSFGVFSSPPAIDIVSNTYEIERNFEEYENKINNGLDDLVAADSIQYIVKLREFLKLGDCVTLNGKVRVISKIETTLEGSELYHTYYLKTKNGFKVPKEYNGRQIGASLDGTVLGVQKDQVKLSVHCDENEYCGANWFSYSTIFSSPDGTGWYCMPENGDAVRLYIPDRDESHAYAISSTHLEPSDSAQRANPDHKSILNSSGKEILLTPTSLILSNNKKMSVEIWDDEGIRIISDKEILINAEESVTIASAKGSLHLIAAEELSFTQQTTQVTLKENVTMGGAQVRIE